MPASKPIGSVCESGNRYFLWLAMQLCHQREGSQGETEFENRTESLAKSPGFENKLPIPASHQNYKEMIFSKPQGTPNTQVLSNM